MREDPRKRLTMHFLVCFASYLAIWTVANLPGLREPWFYFDDFVHMHNAHQHRLAMLYQRGIENGRPIEGLWFFTFLLDGNTAANIALRFVQGTLHVTGAVLAVTWLGQRTRISPLVQWLAGLPFLLWPFGAEATLWRSTCAFPLAMLFAVLAVFAVTAERSRVYRLLGGMLIAVSMLTNQSSAFAALLLWTVGCAVHAAQGRAPVWPKWRLELVILLAGYIIGGVGSILVLHNLATWGSVRGGLATDIVGKLGLLLRLNEEVLFSPRYPVTLRVAHAALLSLAVIIQLVGMHGKAHRTRSALVLATLLAGLVLPYTAVLTTVESWAPWRVMYLGPFVLTLALLTSSAAGRAARLRALAASALVIVVVAHYVPIAWRNSAEYVRVFREDLAFAERVEAFGSRHACDSVCVLTSRDVAIRDWNPYGFEYQHGDSKISAFLKPVVADMFLLRFTRMRPVHGDKVVQEGNERRRARNERPGAVARSMIVSKHQPVVIVFPH